MVKVDLHCHSTFSDGFFSPEEICEHLFNHGVSIASLTDHDSVFGLSRFEKCCKKHGIFYIPGIEITISESIHLLAYGFECRREQLQQELNYFRFHRIKHRPTPKEKLLNWYHRQFKNSGLKLAPPSWKEKFAKAAELIHTKGGKVFLAHPFTISSSVNRIQEILEQMKVMGLDGIETIYPAHTKSMHHEIQAVAEKLDLIQCFGTDYHGYKKVRVTDPSLCDSPFHFGPAHGEREYPGISVSDELLDQFIRSM